MTDSLKSAAYKDRPIDPLDMILDGLIDRISGCSGAVEEEARAAFCDGTGAAARGALPRRDGRKHAY